MPPDRYARQRIFPGVGEAGQARLGKSRAVLVGVGALGCGSAQILARAGVGRLTLCDRDFVEIDNLQRQTLYDEADVASGLPKAEAAARRLRAVNSAIAVEPRVTDVNFSNVEALIKDADVVVDGTDNFETRFVLNDACVKLGKPWVYAGAVASSGMVATIRPGASPCFRCLVAEPPEAGGSATCDTAGVLGAAVGVVSSVAAGEAMKVLLGKTEELLDGLLWIDVWANQYTAFKVARVADCPACVKRDFVYLRGATGTLVTSLCGRHAVQVTPTGAAAIDLAAMEKKLAPAGKVVRNAFLLRADLDGVSLTLFPDGRTIFQGIDDAAKARSLYARFIGS